MRSSFARAWASSTQTSQSGLDSPTRAIYAPPMTWVRLADFSPGTVLLVLASHRYDERDYIRSREEFDRLTGAAR